MNLLFYCCEYPPALTGGIGTVIRLVAEQLVKNGHTVHVLGYYPDTYGLPEYSENNGVHVWRLHLDHRDGKFRGFLYRKLQKIHLGNWMIRRELSYTQCFINRLIRKEKIQLLELPDYDAFCGFDTKLDFCKYPVPTILRVHGSMSFIYSLQNMDIPYLKVNDNAHFKRCDHLSAVSFYALSYVRDHFETGHFKSQKVIYNCLEDEFIAPVPFTDSKTILFIGKLSDTKGCPMLIDAFNLLAEEFPDWNLNLCGNGNIEEARERVLPQWRNRVHFSGFCTRDQIRDAIDHCAFACIPTHFENFGMAALEVMGRQRTLVFTDRTSGPEVVNNGTDGLLVDPENLQQVVEAMRRLMSDRELRTRLGQNAYRKVKDHFSVSEISLQLQDYYQSIIDQNKSLPE